MAPETTVEVRNLTVEDYLDLKSSMISAYAYTGMGDAYWREDAIRRLIRIFPEGQIGVTVNQKVVGCALTLIVDYGRFGDNHTYEQITGRYSFNTHNAKGDVLYGIEVFVHPEYRGMRLARRLYDARKALCEKLNLRAIVAGGRLPGYAAYAGELSPREYISKVRHREIYDPTLTFQLANDFHVKKILKNYLPEDTQSKGLATLIQWDNIYYEPQNDLFRQLKSTVRLGLVQWQMRPHNLHSLLQHIEYFIDTVSDYESDFVVFPELFNAPLMAEFNDLHEHEAIRGLAKYTDALLEKMVEFAVSYNVNIIAGSLPIIRNDQLYNMAYVCRRDGTYDGCEKIHPTPAEVTFWGMRGGDQIKVFDTDCGRIGILICYDVEFPELSRIMALEGMDILFVPFMTDTQNGYNRVRFCAQARAIENECYVAIAGNVGNLPRVNNMDLQFSQSAVFTPSDFAFPVNGIKAEATPNTETIVIADVDLILLKELRQFGSVNNLKDRRKDLYELKWKS
ncbi:bifunctional GNAT family N-acetyltransferase/carbon-nitrogen hydrolase family protein [Compostibacter hankyongensis]|uniref:Bifunctional GNAT family N-acetyltransferase/carbon-nitrogen hydrolase family protein n=1 Tax=Compostibacter hankyongensis TaxID=1007089 RepID=A0ABP8FNF3_9BACT